MLHVFQVTYTVRKYGEQARKKLATIYALNELDAICLLKKVEGDYWALLDLVDRGRDRSFLLGIQRKAGVTQRESA